VEGEAIVMVLDKDGPMIKETDVTLLKEQPVYELQ
jgi:hypothetical protein